MSARAAGGGRMPFAVNHYLCPPDLPLAGFMDAAARHGFRGIGLTRRALAEMPAGAIRAELEARGLAVSSLNSAGYFLAGGELSPTSARDNEDLLRAAERLGAAVLNVIVGGSGEQPLDVARARIEQCLRAFARQARDAGVALVLEPLNPLNVTGRSCLNTIGQALEWIGEAPGTALNVDVFHAWWDPGLPAVLRGGAPVGLYQVCDVEIDAGTGLYRRAPLGEGRVDGLADLEAMRRAYPDVWVELELFAEQMPGRRALDVLARCAESLKSMGGETS